MPELPSGTVTFLFTDIEGSTALWERDQQAMAAAVQRHFHFALLCEAVEAHGGVHFKTVVCGAGHDCNGAVWNPSATQQH